MNLGEAVLTSVLGVAGIALAAYLSDWASRKREDRFFAGLRQSLHPRFDAVERIARDAEKSARGVMDTAVEISTTRKELEDAVRGFEEQGKALSKLVSPSFIQRPYLPGILEFEASPMPDSSDETTPMKDKLSWAIHITGNRYQDFVETLRSLEVQDPVKKQIRSEPIDLKDLDRNVLLFPPRKAA